MLFARISSRQPVRRHLSALSFAGFTPFALPLKDREGPLYADRLLRLMPGKRATFHGRFGVREVVIKAFFHGQKQRSACRRELDGLQALQSAGCPVPEILYVGPSSDDAAALIVLEWLPEARNLSQQLLSTNDPQERQFWLNAAAEALARMHLAGCRQRDLHFGNFVSQGRLLYALDGDAVEQRPGPLARPLCLDNFARFCAQLPPKWDGQLALASEHYWRLRFGSGPSAPDAENVSALSNTDRDQLTAQTARHRAQRLQQMLAKAGRATSWLSQQQTPEWQQLLNRRWDGPAWQAVLAAPITAVDQASQRLKDGNSATVVRIAQPAGDVVLKLYHPKTLWHGLKRRLRLSRAARCFQFAHALQLFDIATPEPIAVLLERKGISRRAIYAAAAVDGEPMRQIFDEHEPAHLPAQHRAAHVIELLTELAALQLVHGDMKHTNFCWQGDKLVVMDLDAMRHVASRSAFRRAQARDCRRFVANFVPGSAWAEYFQQQFSARGWC